MLKVCYSEPDHAEGRRCRLEAKGHAGYAPAGQDIVCAGASTLMQALVYLMAGEENARSEAWDTQEGPCLAVQADAHCEEWVKGAFELAKAGFVLLAERYPENVRYMDISRRGEDGMMDLQMFAEGAESAGPTLSTAQTQQAVASGTMKSGSGERETAERSAPAEPENDNEARMAKTPLQGPKLSEMLGDAPAALRAVQGLHARWAAEEMRMRRSEPGFSLKEELKDPEMRRLMQMPGMRVQDAYRLTHYEEAMHRTAQTVEKGIVERMRQRAARPMENGVRPSGAAVVRTDVAGMTRAQREALERRVMHGAQIEL